MPGLPSRVDVHGEGVWPDLQMASPDANIFGIILSMDVCARPLKHPKPVWPAVGKGEVYLVAENRPFGGSFSRMTSPCLGVISSFLTFSLMTQQFFRAIIRSQSP